MSGDSKRERRGMHCGGARTELAHCQKLVLVRLPQETWGPLNQSEHEHSNIHQSCDQKATCHHEPRVLMCHNAEI